MNFLCEEIFHNTTVKPDTLLPYGFVMEEGRFFLHVRSAMLRWY